MKQKGQKPTGANNNIFEKKMLAYTQLNRFLIAFIDNVNRLILNLLKYFFLHLIFFKDFKRNEIYYS